MFSNSINLLLSRASFVFIFAFLTSPINFTLIRLTPQKAISFANKMPLIDNDIEFHFNSNALSRNWNVLESTRMISQFDIDWMLIMHFYFRSSMNTQTSIDFWRTNILRRFHFIYECSKGVNCCRSRAQTCHIFMKPLKASTSKTQQIKTTSRCS